jgi:hypothetical protein
MLLPNANAGLHGNLYFGGITDAGQTGLRLFGGLVNGTIPAGFIDVCTTDPNDGLRIRVDTTNGGTERMRVTASGNVGIGTPSPNTKLDVAGSLQILTGSNPIRFTAGWTGFPDAVTNQAEISNDTSSYRTLMIVGNRSGGVGRRVSVWDRLEVNGTAFKPGGGAWGSTSDIRLKQNVQPLAGALDKLLRLRGVFFEWKEPEQQGNLTGPQMGLIADEVEEVFPEWISTDPEGYKQLTVCGFEALVVEALRTLKAENDHIKVQNQALETRVVGLEAKLQTSVLMNDGHNNGAAR